MAMIFQLSANKMLPKNELIFWTFSSFPALVGVAGLKPGNTKGGSITVPLTSYLTGLEYAV
jgi:hypothetical protein